MGSHKKQSIKMKIERGESEDWCILFKTNQICINPDTFHPFRRESKKPSTTWVMSSTSNYGEVSAQTRCSSCAFIGQMELCVAHADTVQYHQKSQGLGSLMDKTTTWRPLSQAILRSCRATKLRQRRFRERHRPERQWNWQTWSKFTFFSIGTDRIAIPGLPQSGRTAIDCNFFCKRFRFQEMATPFTSDGV